MVRGDVRRLCAGVTGGVGLWSLTEYSVHRWAMHGRKGANPWSEEHLDHHANPDRTFELAFDRNTMWKVASVPVIGLPVALLTSAAAGRRSGAMVGAAAGAAFAASYATYTHVHHVIHHEAPLTALGRRVRKHHLAHHFSTPKRNFGVTSVATLWDAVLRSGQTPEQLKVARRLAPSWLVDEAGEVRPEYAEDYVLAGRTRRPVGAADIALAMDDRVPVLN